MNYLPVILTSLASQLPLMLVWLVGFVFAIIRWKHHPRVSLLVLFALVLAFIGAILSVVSGMLPLILTQSMDIPMRQVATYTSVFGFLNIALHFVMWVLLMIALFINHKTSSNPSS